MDDFLSPMDSRRAAAEIQAFVMMREGKSDDDISWVTRLRVADVARLREIDEDPEGDEPSSRPRSSPPLTVKPTPEDVITKAKSRGHRLAAQAERVEKSLKELQAKIEEDEQKQAEQRKEHERRERERNAARREVERLERELTAAKATLKGLLGGGVRGPYKKKTTTP